LGSFIFSRNNTVGADLYLLETITIGAAIYLRDDSVGAALYLLELTLVGATSYKKKLYLYL